MAKVKLMFKGFDEMLGKISKMSGDIKAPVEEALLASVKIATPEIHKKMAKHHITGDTEASIREPSVEWAGNIASAKYGFDIKSGGLPSIFLEHGTPTQKATPIIKPAINKVKKQIKAEQEEILTKALRKAGS